VKWRQVDQHYAVSECGFYTVSRCRGLDDIARYTAWYRIASAPSSQTGKAPVHLGCHRSFNLAAEACGAHQQQQPQTAA
jgi:hypothetical protein